MPLLSGAPLGLQQVVERVVGAADTGLWAIHRGQRLVTSGGGVTSAFTVAGAALSIAGGTVDLRFIGDGRGGRTEAVAQVRPAAAGNLVLYRHGGDVEWYRNGPLGLEQGFTIGQRPPGGQAPLTLSMSLSGSLRAHRLGTGVVFLSPTGVALLRYGDLSVNDASGRPLRDALELAGGRLTVRVWDRGAHYPLTVDPFLQAEQKLTVTGESMDGKSGFGFLGWSVALSADGNTALIGGPTDNTDVGAAWVFTRSGATWAQQGNQLTAKGEVGQGAFGYSVALSADGNTALVGAPNSNTVEGGAWVFTRSGATWKGQASLPVCITCRGIGNIGWSVALSADGNTALVGGSDYSGQSGVAAAQWVYTRSGSTWSQQVRRLFATGEVSNGRYYYTIALSADGDTALIGGPQDNYGVGAAWVFTRSGATWAQQGKKLTATGEVGYAWFGCAVALSSTGNTALIGGCYDQSRSEKGGVGAAWVFTRSGSSWAQQGKKLTGTGELGQGQFGHSVALSADGNTALIGGWDDDNEVGAAWVFTRSGSIWAQQGEKMTVREAGFGLSRFGYSVALSADGNTALIGGPADGFTLAGAAWVFSHSNA